MGAPEEGPSRPARRGGDVHAGSAGPRAAPGGAPEGRAPRDRDRPRSGGVADVRPRHRHGAREAGRPTRPDARRGGARDRVGARPPPAARGRDAQPRDPARAAGPEPPRARRASHRTFSGTSCASSVRSRPPTCGRAPERRSAATSRSRSRWSSRRRTSASRTDRPRRSSRARWTSSSRRTASGTSSTGSPTRSAAASTALVAHYAPQVAHYRRAWETLTGQKAKAGLFFMDTGELVWLEEKRGKEKIFEGNRRGRISLKRRPRGARRPVTGVAYHSKNDEEPLSAARIGRRVLRMPRPCGEDRDRARRQAVHPEALRSPSSGLHLPRQEDADPGQGAARNFPRVPARRAIAAKGKSSTRPRSEASWSS